MEMDSDGVGEGTVGVRVGVCVGVVVPVGWMNVGVKVKVFVDILRVGVREAADTNSVDVEAAVTDCRELATVGGRSIPVNRSAVVPIPMKTPTERYFISALISG